MHVLIESTHNIHSSETCQYNSNVLTLVAVTCNVAGLIDFSEDCLIRITKSTTNMFACGTLRMKDPKLIDIPLQM